MSERPVLLVVLGTRPEAIKLGTVIPLLRKNAVFHTVVMWTGQHPLNELGKVAELFAIKPDIVLPDDAMDRKKWTLAPEDVPDAVLVQGDTRSTAFGAMIAEKLGAKLIHLEAGLRCWDMTLPEERIRVAVDEQADLLLCPSRASAINARMTAKPDAVVRFVGQTGLDALFQIRDYGVPPEIDEQFTEHLGRGIGNMWGGDGVDKALLTVHRAARTEHPGALWSLVIGLDKLDPDLDVIWPVHPRIRKHRDPAYRKILDYAARKGITICDPIPYEVMAHVLSDFDVVITDSGGLVEECAALQVPCVIARPNTERIEVVGAGYAVVCPNDQKLPNAVHAARDRSRISAAQENITIIQGAGNQLLHNRNFTEYGEPGRSSWKVLYHIELFLSGEDMLSPPDPKDSPDA